MKFKISHYDVVDRDRDRSVSGAWLIILVKVQCTSYFTSETRHINEESPYINLSNDYQFVKRFYPFPTIVYFSWQYLEYLIFLDIISTLILPAISNSWFFSSALNFRLIFIAPYIKYRYCLLYCINDYNCSSFPLWYILIAKGNGM